MTRSEHDTRRKIVDRAAAAGLAERARAVGEVVVFTNGCFDLLHAGHVHCLEASRAMGDRLMVGVNTDGSVRALKGAGRPVVDDEGRARLVAALACVDWVVPFAEQTPATLIRAVRPDILTKGAEYGLDEIVGADAVLEAGGRVERIDRLRGRSTSEIVERIRADGKETDR